MKNAVLKWVALRRLRRYADPNMNAIAKQQMALREAMLSIAGSEWAAHLGVDPAMPVDGFQAKVPIQHYNDHKPFIDRMADGSKKALFSPTTKVLFLAWSSGTTGARKLIPITASALKHIKRARWTWLLTTKMHHPYLSVKRGARLPSNAFDQYSAGGIPIGAYSGFIAKSYPIMRRLSPVPQVIDGVTNEQAKQYILFRYTIDRPDLRSFMAVTPSYLVAMANWIRTHREQLLYDIANGKISGDPDNQLKGTIRRKLLTPDSATAKRLERIFSKEDFRASELWPDLKVIFCWTGGTLGHYKDFLREEYGNVILRDTGYEASEGNFTTILDDETSSGVLNLGGNFFEFISEKDNEVHLAHQLKKGEVYRIVITNCQGFVRYDIGDVVECTGFRGKWPMIRFCSKGSDVSDLTGEKLTAHQVSTAMIRAMESENLVLSDFVLSPVHERTAYYRLFVARDGGLESIDSSSLGMTLDKHLCALNDMYQYSRKAGILNGVQIEPVSKNSFVRWHRKLLDERQGSLAQFKPPCLTNYVLDLADAK